MLFNLSLWVSKDVSLARSNSKMRFCRIVFLLRSCVLPALFILLLGMIWHRPGYVCSQAKRLSRRLGLDVSLDGLKYLRPGIVLYEVLQLTDPADAPIGAALPRAGVQYSRVTDAEGRQKSSLTLIASQPEIQAYGIRRLWQLISQPLELRGDQADLDLRLAADDATLKSPQIAATLTEVQGSIECLTDGSQAQLTFRLAGAEMPQPARIRIVRNRQVVPPGAASRSTRAAGSMP